MPGDDDELGWAGSYQKPTLSAELAALKQLILIDLTPTIQLLEAEVEDVYPNDDRELAYSHVQIARAQLQQAVSQLDLAQTYAARARARKHER